LEIDFAEMDILQLAYPDNYFDAVFSLAVFECDSRIPAGVSGNDAGP
jgi:ubiquinone/menaquinone biosynthesis C-methylase UbiE